MSSNIHYSASVLVDGPLFYWRLAEPVTGAAFPSKAFDASGNNNTGSYTNIGSTVLFAAPALVPAQLEPNQLDTSILGQDSFVLSVGGSGSVRMQTTQLLIGSGTTGSFTVEFWAMPKSFGSGSNYMVVAATSSIAAPFGDGYFQFRMLASGSAECGINSTDKFTAIDIPSGSFKVGRRDHIVFTYDASAQIGRFYRDGRLFAGPKAMVRPSGSWPEFIIGNPRTSGSTWWNGQFDEVAVYRSVLSDIRIRSHWNAAFSSYRQQVICDAPKLYWRMGDTSGSTPQFRDYSSNSRSGTFVGSPTGLIFSGSSLVSNDIDTSLSGNTVGVAFAQYAGSMEVGGNPLINQFSVEWWFKPGTLGLGNNTVGRGKTWFTAGGSGSSGEGFAGIGITDLIGPPQLGPGFFQFDKVGHYVFTYDGAAARVFKNGQRIVAQRMTAPVSWGATDSFKIAVSGAWQGTYDEVAVYGYPLSDQRVLDHWQEGFNVTASGQPAPTFTSLSGSRAIIAGGDYLCVSGSNFQLSASVLVRSGTFIASASLPRVDLTGTLTFVYFNAPAVPTTGTYDVIVLNPDSGVVTGSAVLTYVTGSPYESTIVADRPIMYWQLRDISGSLSTADRSNHLNTGSILNSSPFLTYATQSLTYDRGKGDLAMAEFNSAAPVPFITITAPNINVAYPKQTVIGIGGTAGSQNFSVEFWIKMRSGVPGSYPIAGDTGTPRAGFNVPGFLLNVTTASIGTTTVATDSTTAITASGFFSGTNITHHVVYTFSSSLGSTAGSGSLYRDGRLIVAALQTTPATWQAFQMLGPFSGTFDEIAVYDYPLTSGQVSAHYEIGYVQESQDFGSAGGFVQLIDVPGMSRVGDLRSDIGSLVDGLPSTRTFEDFASAFFGLVQGEISGFGAEDLMVFPTEAFEGPGIIDSQINCEFLFFASGSVGGGSTDTVPPVITNFSPGFGNPITTFQTINFDVTDNTGQFRRIMLLARISGISGSEVIHDGEVFDQRHYKNVTNVRTPITGGFNYTILRDGGWPGQVTLVPLAHDIFGNENT